MKFLKQMSFLFFVIASIWLGGLLWFQGQIPLKRIATKEKLDAVVVLTGGSDRLSDGFDLFASGYGKKLFISGVGEGVTISELLDIVPSNSPIKSLMNSITLGYAAKSTKGNALEVAKWVEKEGYTSLYLVTSSYHIVRSLFEFSKVMPGKKISPYPVFSENVKLDGWWKFPGSRKLIISEYNKYLLSSVATAMVDRKG